MATNNNGKRQSSKAEIDNGAPNKARKPVMPSVSAVSNARKGGLGRGLGALIPTGNARPSLGNGAADVILGAHSPSGRSARSAEISPVTEPAPGATKGHSDETTVSAGQGSDTKVVAKNSPIEDSTKRSQTGVAGSAEDSGVKRNGSQANGLDDQSTSSADANELTTDTNFGATYREISLGDIRTNAKQPRSVFDEEALQELEHSIREFGLMQPIVVREAPDADTHYELIMGERRLRASQRAGLQVIPAIVRETDDEEMLRDALLENIHRVQLNPLEEASAYQQLLEEFGVTQAELGRRIGRSRPRITNMIRLLQLPVGVQRRVAAGVLSSGHARALLSVRAGADTQDKLANRIIAEGMSVRATEEAVVLLNRQAGDDTSKKKGQGSKPPLPSHVNHWVDDISDALETKVSVQMGKKKGKIVVEFGGPEDFDRIVEMLKFESD